MAEPSADTQPRGSAEFVESSVLEAVVPSESDVNLKDEFGSWDGSVDDEENPAILPFVSQRQFLIFDELVPVYVVFRTPFVDETTLRSYLSRLAINLEAFAYGLAPPPENQEKPAPSKELIFSETIKDNVEPIVVWHDRDENAHKYVIWKLGIFITRPRGRFHKPAIYFQPTASLKPVEKTRSLTVDEYLPSRIPTALNLLQSFESDPALAGIHPRLSALRINKIAPTTPVAKEILRPIRTGQRRLFRVLPALTYRTKFTKVQASLQDMSLMASLDLEVVPISGCSVDLKDVDLSLRGGQVKTLAGDRGVTTVHGPGDQLTYLFKITPDLALDGTPVLGVDGHILTLHVKAKVLVSEDCQPILSIEWRTGVDFTAEQSSNLIRAAHRFSNPSNSLPKASGPDSLPAHSTNSQQDNHASETPINATITISGPPRVQVGETFYWDLFLVNRSEKSRKLAVLVLPKRKKDYERHRAHPSTSSVSGVRNDKDLTASAVVDENIVYAKQKSARTEVADLICLTTDIRIGHLAPGACYTAGLKFLALAPGVLSVDALRLVDLATNETCDIRDLPSLVAAEKKY